MALNNNDQVSVRNYLLGHLGDEEQQKIEERLMLEDDLFEELEISKGELIEEYRAGELSQKEREWFERHFLGSAEGKQRYTFSEAMDLVATRNKPEPESLSWFRRLQNILGASPWVISTATAGVILITVGIIFSIRSPQPQGSLAVTLTNSALTRSNTGATKYTRVALKPDVGEVRLTLPLPAGATPGVDYRVELDNRSERKNLKPSAHDANSVSVVIPAAQLPPGPYALILFAVQADKTEQAIPGHYFFNVERED